MSAWQPTSVVLMAAVLAACGGGGGDSNASPAPTPTPTPTPTPQLTTLRADLGSPWSLAVLPDGRLLVTQRSGGLLRLSADGRQMEPIFGLPAVDAAGQGGLLDIALDPDFSQNGFLYLSFSEPGTGSESGRSGTAVFKARLQGAALVEGQVIFRQTPKVSGAGHYGSRLVFSRDKTLFVTLGERQQGSPAQDLGKTLGKVVRIARDGSMPPDNPALGPGAAPGIYSLGHRNPQGAALHPQTGELWVSEHGPQGGDEINRIVPGGNYGWPVRSYGCNYGDPVGDACRIGGGTHAPAYLEPLTYWVPISVAPAGLLFYTGAMFPEWQGQLFSGSLAGQALWRLRLSGTTVLERTALYGNLGERFRDVRQAPDGALLLLTDSGKLLRLYR
ncbi:PQQ-dependent sugar dehydrogenase [Pelomonas sp. APW6]|uniref:PQQ-dependent sugar dehydrogenase n=1 Tax=Roseateles subflavus TaxID=3053353 RepID=A0ABT7LF03_9BURK|nr:PQQ-dependent sugar dehydrogenase [Pelomonas sp. APW6]MDL5031430.1 PQQ-dependent sugar dehydrogenase [Pelomonas sp. APW6]